MSSEAEREAEVRANDLYWKSDLSVNQIAEDLELSKGTLYEIIRPLPTGSFCPECGEEVVYANRTARDRGMVSCARCGWEGDTDDAMQSGDVGISLQHRFGSMAERLEEMDDVTRKRTILGGAFLGAAAGLALVFWARRR